MIEYITSGESHGRAIVAVVKGIPAGLEVDVDFINAELSRRQKGVGRGGRMKIEKDKIDILAGVRNGRTTGAPLTLIVWNKDWENWKNLDVPPLTNPRPGHADLTGYLKYGTEDIRDILERASARETAVRVAVGSVAKMLLEKVNTKILSWVEVLGGVKADTSPAYSMPFDKLFEVVESSPVRTPDGEAEAKMIDEIEKAKKKGDTLGGIIAVRVFNPPSALGSHTHWKDKLDARIAMAVLSVQAIKGVEFGRGFEMAYLTGSQVHDEILWDEKRQIYTRPTNNAGGIEGGISNGQDIIVRAVMKPIATLRKPLRTVDVLTHEPRTAAKERSDITAVPSAGVVLESVIAVEIANALIERYGGDTVQSIVERYKSDSAQKLTGKV